MLIAANKTTQLTGAEIASSYNKAFECKSFLAGPCGWRWMPKSKVLYRVKTILLLCFVVVVCLIFSLLFYWEEGKKNKHQPKPRIHSGFVFLYWFVCPCPSYTLLLGKPVTNIFNYYSGRQALIEKKRNRHG